MGQFGGFYKGEKKKKKRDEEKSRISVSPVFTPPTITGKSKSKQ